MSSKNPPKTATLRLNAALARMGVASRRKADELIRDGRVWINGKVVTELGTRVDLYRQTISIDGAPLEKPSKRFVYLAMYKPRCVITTMSDPEGRRTVATLLPKSPRLFPIGRLDYDAEGLLLFTNDGDVAHKLMHPKFGALRTYNVKVKGIPAPETLTKLRRGVKLEDGFCKPVDVKFDRSARANSWYRITVDEGRNRLIKRLWLRLEHPVQRLVRVEYAGVKLGTLGVGDVRPLTLPEIELLKKV